MTQTARIPLLVPDLRTASFAVLAGPVTATAVFQRVLPGERQRPASEAGFSSAL